MSKIKELRQAAGLSQAALGAAIGADAMLISRLERGERRLSAETAIKLAAALSVPVGQLMGDAGIVASVKVTQSQDKLPAGATLYTPGGRDLPIRGLAMGGDGHMQMSSDAVDWTWRPPELAGVKHAFALFATGDSMEDAVMEGTILLVHPHQPVRPRDLCVIELVSGELIVKRLLRRTAKEYQLRQYNPPMDFAVAVDEIRHCWRVCGTQMP